MRWPRAQRLKAVALSAIMTVGVATGHLGTLAKRYTPSAAWAAKLRVAEPKQSAAVAQVLPLRRH
jgi:hypothetical protein